MIKHGARGAAFGVMVLLACLLLAAFPATAQNATAPVASAPVSGGQAPVSVVPEATDPEISNRLQRILATTGWFEAPVVAVQEGVAFLDGKADTLEHRRWAGELATSTEGVVAVVNRLEIQADVASIFDRAALEIGNVLKQIFQAWPLALVAVLIIGISWLIARLVALAARWLLAERIRSPLLRSVVVRAIAIPVFLLGLYFVLQVAGLTELALTLIGGTGLIGIIIGFAFRDIAENFLASLLLSMRNPFNGGDLIEVAGYVGVVQNLNTRSTVLLTMDGNHVQIPNSTVYKSTIKNYSSIPSRRAEFLISISYDSSIAKAQKLIDEVLTAHPAVLNDPEPLVLVDELASTTVNLRVFYWFDSAAYSPAKINSALLRQCKNALLDGQIHLNSPAQAMVFPEGVELVRPGEMLPPPTSEPGRASHGEASNATEAEGDLTSETSDIGVRSTGRVPEAETNLLRE